MNGTPASTRPAEARKRAQRERILAAAQERFIESGFHSASMAAIAESAGVSPGLIYRYFENKNAIILDIIDRQLGLARQRIREARSTEDLCSGIVGYFDAHDGEEIGSMSVALFLEIGAEGTRDPEIARALDRFDDGVRAELVDWLQRPVADGGYGFAAATARERALALVLLFEGIKVRKAREPGLDRGLLRNAVNGLLGALEL